LGGAGGLVGGVAGSITSGAGGDGGDVTVGDMSVLEGGDSEDCSEEAVHDRGERRSSPSPSKPRNSSTSLRRLLLFLFGGGVRISGDEAGGTSCWGLGDVGVGGAGLGVEALSPAGVSAATVAVVDERSVPVLAVVAVRLRCQRRRRRRFPAVVVDEEAVGRLQDTVNTCRPEAWQNVRRALKPLAKQHS
jgi:hypothetical protein